MRSWHPQKLRSPPYFLESAICNKTELPTCVGVLLRMWEGNLPARSELQHHLRRTSPSALESKTLIIKSTSCSQHKCTTAHIYRDCATLEQWVIKPREQDQEHPTQTEGCWLWLLENMVPMPLGPYQCEQLPWSLKSIRNPLNAQDFLYQWKQQYKEGFSCNANTNVVLPLNLCQ